MLKLSKNIFLFILQIIQVIISQKELVFQFFSNRLNARPYNKLDKKIADFKEPKGGPVVPHTTKCFHHQNRKNTDKDKKYKIHTQYQRQNECHKMIACSFAYIQHRKKVGA